jgi:hypothetical protein
MAFHVTENGNGFSVSSDSDYHGSVERIPHNGYYRATYINDEGIQTMLCEDADDAITYITDLATAELAS